MFNLSLPTMNFGFKVILVLAIVVLLMNVAGLTSYKKYLGLS
jgi:CHASE3 domain sensor protein